MPVRPHSNADNFSNIASLNHDGTVKWFIPPYIVPFVVLALIAMRALWLA